MSWNVRTLKTKELYKPGKVMRKQSKGLGQNDKPGLYNESGSYGVSGPIKLKNSIDQGRIMSKWSRTLEQHDKSGLYNECRYD